MQCKKDPPLYVFAGTNGFKNKTPVSKNSLFPIGSITKSFISVVILQIAKENNVSIDDPTLIAKYFPEYPKWGNITLRQLMNMTSGIPSNSSDSPDDIFLKFTGKEYKNYNSPTKLLGLAYKLPVHFIPGKHFEYSNANYTLLGQFIEKVTHHDPQYEVSQRIFIKLKMAHSYFPKDRLFMIPGIDKSAIVNTYSFYPEKGFKQYSFIPEGQEFSRWSMSVYNSAGAIVSTPADINTYVHALYNPGPLLDATQIKNLTTMVSKITGQPLTVKKDVKELGFGLGVIGFYSPKVNHVIFGYNGSTNGGTFYYLYDPEAQLYLSYAVNLNQSSGVADLDNSLALFANLKDYCK